MWQRQAGWGRWSNANGGACSQRPGTGRPSGAGSGRSHQRVEAGLSPYKCHRVYPPTLDGAWAYSTYAILRLWCGRRKRRVLLLLCCCLCLSFPQSTSPSSSFNRQQLSLFKLTVVVGALFEVFGELEFKTGMSACI